MTNSQASALRARRFQVNRGLFILGLMVVATALVSFIALKLYKDVKFPDLSGILNPSVKKVDSAIKIKAKAEPVQKKPPVTAGAKSVASVRVLDQAFRNLSQEIEKSPNNPSLQNQLGLIYISLGDNKEAELCFKNSVSLARSNLTTLVSDIEQSKASGKMNDAAKTLVKASALSVELSAAHSNLARLYDLRGNREQVIAELNELNQDSILFNELNPINGNSKLKEGPDQTESQALARAEMYLRQNKIPLAIEAYQSILKNNPKAAIAHERLGMIAAMSSDFPQAVREWEAAAELEPKSSAVQNNLGLAYLKMGLKDEAEASFRHSLTLDPKSEEAALNLSEILSSDGQTGQAIYVLRQTVKQKPDSARAHNNLATLLSLSGSYPDAISEYNKTLQIDPSMASAHYGMGVTLMHNRSYRPAIKSLKQAIALDPKIHSAETKLEEAYRLAARN